MASYQSIPDVANEDGDTTGDSQSLMERIVSAVTSKVTLGIALACALVALVMSSSSKEGLTAPAVPLTPEAIHWPSYLEGSQGTVLGPFRNKYVPDVEIEKVARRPATTEEATEFGWKKLDENCVAGLGHPWAFDGTVTEETPVTLYFTEGGAVNGIAVHYFNDAAPSYLIERGVFEKGEAYDTISLTFSETDVCESGVQTKPVVDVLMTDGRRQSIPMTQDAADSNDWRKGRCLGATPLTPMMGTHWMYDVDGGKDFSWDAGTFFPVVPMYHETEGTLNGIFFTAPHKMQSNYPDDCFPPPFGIKTLEEVGVCVKASNMWDGGPGLRGNITRPLFMCANFCNCPPTGFSDTERFQTMHWFFNKEAERGECEITFPQTAEDCLLVKTT